GKDEPVTSSAPVRVFLMGANRWREEREWPPPEARAVKLYMDGEGSANTLAGDGVLRERKPAQDAIASYIYDPRNPVPTGGGTVCCNPAVFPWGPLDQRAVERRRDVLVYTTEPLKSDLEVLGPVKVVLWAASDTPDTDFTAKLVD